MSDIIRRPAHVAIRVPHLDASIEWATTVMGLRVTQRDGDTAYLTHGACHHSLMYIGGGGEAALDHVALEAHDDAALDRLADRLGDEGVALESEEPQERGLRKAIRFRTPAGHLLEVFSGMEEAEPGHPGAGIPPRKFGHPMLVSEDSKPTRRFFEEVLGFRLSDDVGDGTLTFMRCNPDHHGVGVGRGPRTGLNHYAWGVENLAVLGQLADVLAARGHRFIWGPGRHGAGRNLFTYHFDPAGCIVEYYADLYQVWDERTYEPGHWELGDYRFENLWGAGAPREMMETATPQA